MQVHPKLVSRVGLVSLGCQEILLQSCSGSQQYMQGSPKCPYTLIVLAWAWNTCIPHLWDLNVRLTSCPFCFQSWELGRRVLGMVVQGSSVPIPPPAAPCLPHCPRRSSAASPCENTPQKILCSFTGFGGNAKSPPTSPLPRNQVVCVCLHACTCQVSAYREFWHLTSKPAEKILLRKQWRNFIAKHNNAAGF